MREAALTLVVGARRHGKSTVIKKIVDASKKNVLMYQVKPDASATLDRPPKNFFFGNHPDGKFSIYISDIDYYEFLKYIQTLRNYLIVIDDAFFHEGAILSKELKQLAVMCSHYGHDLVLVYHGVSYIPRQILLYCNYILLFKTGENISKAEEKLGDRYTQVLRAFYFVRNNPNKYFNTLIKFQ